VTSRPFLSALDHFITSAAAGSHNRTHVNRLQASAGAARIDISLASNESSLLLPAGIERSSSLRPTAPRSSEPHCPIWWDVYPAFPNSIGPGEIEAADQREVERAARKFEQNPAVVIVMRRA
jgi:hypothetical protein